MGGGQHGQVAGGLLKKFKRPIKKLSFCLFTSRSMSSNFLGVWMSQSARLLSHLYLVTPGNKAMTMIMCVLG